MAGVGRKISLKHFITRTENPISLMQYHAHLHFMYTVEGIFKTKTQYMIRNLDVLI